jgi:hypothetical protein
VKGSILLIVLLIVTWQVQAQLLVSTAPFSAATPFLEPDGRREILKISEKEFVVVSKVKGGLNGDSDYSLEKYDHEMKNYFKTIFTLAAHEDIKDIHFNGAHIVVFIISHSLESAESRLLAYGFSPTNGIKSWDKILMKFKVNPFQLVRSRGSVEETFENAIASSINKSFVVPFEYQYDIQFSPDKSKIIAYTFDYTKPNLIANATIFDGNLNQLKTGVVPIDNNFINYGIYVNNRGDVYIMNVDKLGRIVVIQYDLVTKDNKLLDIQYASTQRESLKLAFKNDDELFVGCANTFEGELVGVMYTKFNFQKNLVEKINYHEMSDGLLQTADIMRGSNKDVKGPETWKFFEMTNFYVNNFEKVVMVFEKRELQGYEYVYTSESVLTPERWKERVAKVNAEAVVMFSFNANDELMWENYFLKSQTNDVTSGIISSSMIMDISDEYLKMVYATSDNAAGTYSVFNYVLWDASNGNKVKELILDNEEKLALVRNYSIMLDDKLILVGRKGLLGKKYVMNLYKLNQTN